MTDIVWTPRHPEKTRLWDFMRALETRFQTQFKDYEALHRFSIEKIPEFWEALASYFKVQWDTLPTSILKTHGKNPWIHSEWFEGASLNVARELLSRQDDKLALISLDEEGLRFRLTYRELTHQVASFAAALRSFGVVPGTRVAAVMPNVSETIVAMLATASLGAVWSSCSSDFGVQAIVDRFSQITPEILIITDGHRYGGKIHSSKEKIVALNTALPTVKKIVVCSVIHEDLTDLLSSKVVQMEPYLQGETQIHFKSMPFDSPWVILYSSGTTGKPKCMVHGAGGTLLQHLKELALHTNLGETDNLCFYTTCGWMMWNWTVSALALGSTLTLYEGSPTHSHSLKMFEIIEAEKVTVFGTSAKFLAVVEKTGLSPQEKYDLSALKTIVSTGSPLLPKQYDFVYQQVNADLQLSSISGGSDLVSCFALGNPLLPVRRGELQSLGLGMAVEVFDEQGHSIIGHSGELVCTKPFPSRPLYFWNDHEENLYKHAYFERYPGIWTHGDFAEITAHHGLIIYGRSDAILNPGGVRIGSAEIYQQCALIPEILDSVVIGQRVEDDVRLVLFVKLKPNLKLDEALCVKIRTCIRANTSPRHVPAKILQVPDLPYTRNGKLMEVAVRQAVEGEAVNQQAMINPEVLVYFQGREELKH